MPKLVIIPTPIGNLEDITLRALKILKEADFVLAEDTRTSGNLLKHFDISNKLYSYHIHNEHKIINTVIQKIKEANTVALMSDAGTPGVSDPGFLLIRECINNDIEIECLPGATAFVPALINSGLPSDRFIFEGFLPVKKGRSTKLNQLAETNCTMIFYESPFRLIKTLEQFINTFGFDRKACVCRELTKIHEESVRGNLQEIWEHYKEKTIKGEIVIIVEGKN